MNYKLRLAKPAGPHFPDVQRAFAVHSTYLQVDPGLLAIPTVGLTEQSLSSDFIYILN